MYRPSCPERRPGSKPSEHPLTVPPRLPATNKPENMVKEGTKRNEKKHRPDDYRERTKHVTASRQRKSRPAARKKEKRPPAIRVSLSSSSTSPSRVPIPEEGLGGRLAGHATNQAARHTNGGTTWHSCAAHHEGRDAKDHEETGSSQNTTDLAMEETLGHQLPRGGG